MDIPQPWVLSTDRTEWSFGEKRFNVLLLGVVHNGLAYRVVWKMLEKKGNSNSDERMDLLERFYSIFPNAKVAYLTGEREFIGKSWLSYLLIEPTIRFRLRIRESVRINDGRKELRASIIFAHLQPGQTQVLSGKKLVWGRLVYVSALRLDNGELLIVVTPDSCDTAISDYGQRWGIETLFGMFKTRGFCLESTHFNNFLPTEIRELQALVRRLDDLMEMRHQEMNRIKANFHLESVQNSLEKLVEYLEQQIQNIKNLIRHQIQEHPLLLEQQELLISIPGIAEITAAKLLAEIPNLKNYKTARQAAAYAGLTPQQRVSGTSVRGKSCLSKKGNSRVRKALYMPAVVAQRHNPIIQQFRDRLRQKGKHPIAILGALMRKLLHIAYGVIKTGKPFDPNYAQIA